MSEMLAKRLSETEIQIPTIDEVAGGGLAHGTEVIGPDDPRYADYDAWLAQQEEEEEEDDDRRD
jgi:hypothetical protein